MQKNLPGNRPPDDERRHRPTERRSVDPIINALEVMQRSIDARHQENVKNFLELKAKVDRVIGGFPDGDPEGHCSYHEIIIKEALKREKLWDEIHAHILKGGALALLGGVCWGAWELFIFKFFGR